MFRQSMMEIILFVLCVLLAFRAPGFFTADNALNILRNVSMQGIIAFGMTMVIIAGEIDLSVGSAVAFSGCLAAWLTRAMGGGAGAVTAASAASLAAGVGIGALNGFLRVRFRVPTFITTLAWLTVLRGVAGLVTGGFPITSFPPGYNALGGGYVAGIPVPALFFLGVFAAVQFVMGWTTFGRAVYAVGGNPEAARLSGIPVNRVKVAVMAAVAGLAALSGLLNASQIMSGSATTAEGWELDVIAAVIIGGTSLMGGSGRVWGTFIGVLFLGVLSNGMTLLDFSTYWQLVVRGALILAAVLLNVAPGGKGRNL
jgi:ribose/xylose/arabinose/galactoside ABC-type transport system permease subunit